MSRYCRAEAPRRAGATVWHNDTSQLTRMCMSVSRQLSSLCQRAPRAAWECANPALACRDSQKRQIWYGVCGRRVLRYPARSGDTLYRNRIGIRTPRPTPATPGRTAGLVSAESGAGASGERIPTALGPWAVRIGHYLTHSDVSTHTHPSFSGHDERDFMHCSLIAPTTTRYG